MDCSPQNLRAVFLSISLFLLAGCGGGGGTSAPPPPADFIINLSTQTLSIAQDATSSPVNVSVTGTNGFSGSVQVSFSGLPTGLVTNPSGSFTVTNGGSTPVTFGAAMNASTGNFTVAAQGTGGGISHSTNLAVTIQPAIAQAWPRTTYARTDAVPAMDDPSGEPRHRKIAYDSANKHVFVANRAANRVEVFSSTTQALVTEISVPGASSVDVSADGSTIWVGTVTQQVLAISAASLTVTSEYSIPSLTPLPNTTFDLPEEVVAMSGGQLYMRLRQSGSTEDLLALWNPSSNTLTNLTSAEPQLFQNGLGVMTRTGDQTKLLVAANDTSGELAVFAANGSVLAGPHGLGTGTIPLAAANPSGTNYAVAFVSNGTPQLLLLNSSLTVIAGPISFNPNGLAFSLDGNFLYASASSSAQPAVTVFNGSNLQVVGQVSDASIQGVHSEIEQADETQLLFGIVNRGIGFVDATSPVTLPPTQPSFGVAPTSQPAEGPNVGGTATILTGQNFSSTPQIKFGTNAATNVNVTNVAQIQVNSPPSATTGEANVSAFFSGGWLTIAPDAFSYGPEILDVLPNSGNASGGDSIQIYGYGFGSNAGNISVLIGGASATVQKVESVTTIAPSLGFDATYPFSLERITLQTPAGTPGEASVTVTSAVGTATSRNAFQYVQSATVYARQAQYNFLTYDQQRQLLYLSDIDHIDIFDLQAGAFRPTGLTLSCKVSSGAIVSGPCPSAGLRGLSLTPDGKTLIAADFGSQNVYLLNPDAPGTVTLVPVGGIAGFVNSGPARVAATNLGTVFVGMSGEGGSSGSGGCNACLSQMNLSATPPTVQPAPEPIVASVVGAPLVQGNAAGDHVFVAFDSTSGGPVAEWLAASPTQFTLSSANELTTDLAVSADGTMLASRTSSTAEIRNGSLSVQSMPITREIEQVPARAWVPGIAMHPSGALLYQPFLTGPAPAAPPATGIQGGVDIVDSHSGRLRLRMILPDTLAMLSNDVDGLHGGFLTLDENGQRIFALTTAGLTIVQLANVPLGIGTISPASGPAAGGTSVTIRGSGFQSGATATIGGKSASVTFVDMNTLTVTTPSVSTGAQQIVITNPNGDTASLAAAFIAN